MYVNYTSSSKNQHKAHNWRYSDEDLMTSAARYKHRSEWKKNANKHYQAAFWRGIIDKCCAHMTPKAHPYSGSYIVYAYEFTDHCVYVGHTFQPSARKWQHMQRGPVLAHMAICSNHSYKILADGLNSPAESSNAEAYWQAKYKEDGWTPLWIAKAGGLGTVQVIKWAREAVMAEAKKYQTRQEWINKSQMSYRSAKRNGWFDEASAHMPKRKLGVGVGRTVSKATRDKQRAAKVGKIQSDAAKQAKSVAIKQWWADRIATTESRIKSTLMKLPPAKTNEQLLYDAIITAAGQILKHTVGESLVLVSAGESNWHRPVK